MYQFPHIGEFQVMGEHHTGYNCLGWSVRLMASLRDNKYIHKAVDIVGFMASHGFMSTQEAYLADIDVWGKYDPMTLRYHVTHYSLRTGDRWTSKLGDCQLIVHDRGGLVNPEWYGTIVGHFMKAPPGLASSPTHRVPYGSSRFGCDSCRGLGHTVPIVDRALSVQCLELNEGQTGWQTKTKRRNPMEMQL